MSEELKALLAEARIHATEHSSKDVRYFAQGVIETLTKQAEMIEQCRVALELGREYVRQALTEFDNQYRNHPAVEDERRAICEDMRVIDAAIASLKTKESNSAV